ncbi:MAG: hypothetical protein WBP40_02250 [Candidatus Moraniibacteriota bacterium]
MRWNLQNWIEEVKTKPEHIRQRYVVGCVFASMFFVIIVWSLTVSENFKSTVAKTEDVTASAAGILPKPSDFSLDELLSGDKAPDTSMPKSGEEFLREQVENRTRINPDEEGVIPKADRAPKEDADPTTMPVR